MTYYVAEDSTFDDEPNWGKIFYFEKGILSLFISSTCPLGAVSVDLHLDALINSARDYPPALAMAKRDLYYRHFSERRELIEAVRERLEHYLHGQINHRYLMAKAARDDGVEFAKGAYYWVTDCDLSKGLIYWIARDYEFNVTQLDSFNETSTISTFLERPC